MFEEEYGELMNKSIAIKLSIKESGTLQLDPNVTHPFVKVHIVDINTCKYLAKTNPDQPGVSNLEHTALLNSKGEFTNKKVDFLMPVATSFFDMRLKGQT